MKEFVDWKLSQVSVSLLVGSEFFCASPVIARESQPLLFCTFNHRSFLWVAQPGCLTCLYVPVTPGWEAYFILFFLMFCSIIIFPLQKLETSRIPRICLDWHQEVNCAAQGGSTHQKPSRVLCVCEAEAVQLKHTENNDVLRYLVPQVHNRI